eukprot:GHVS01008022.1.p1 GENE.GHVS01008022.1~~GHVS01008022.1.p1  ORF type:complete len:642 (+),score=110.25 GHVS01008022.1:267-2192(+)
MEPSTEKSIPIFMDSQEAEYSQTKDKLEIASSSADNNNSSLITTPGGGGVSSSSSPPSPCEDDSCLHSSSMTHPTTSRRTSRVSAAAVAMSQQQSRALAMDMAEPSSKVVKPPLGLNRWMFLGFYVIYCFVTGPAYFSWASLRDMLFYDGAYSWLCTGPPTASSATSSCAEQDTAVNGLLTLIGTSHFVASAAAGLILDSAGPKVTAVIGVAMQMLGWILLGASSKSFQAYPAAAVILGLGVDGAFFPCISGANIFPSYVSSVIAVLGASRSASFYVIYFMEVAVVKQGTLSFSTVCYGFSCLFLGLCLAVAALLIPLRSFPAPRSLTPLPPTNTTAGDTLKEAQQPAYAGLDDATRRGSAKLSAAGSRRESAEVNHGSRRASFVATAAAAGGRRGSFVPIATAGSVAVINLAEAEAPPKRVKFFSEVFSIFYVPILILFSITLQRCFFFGASTGVFLNDTVSEVFKVLSPLSFIPCPFLGLMADKCGIMWVMMVCNTAGTALIAFAMIPGIPASVACQYICVLMYCLHVSFLLSQIYCYIADTFSQANMGKLIGLICAIAGLINLSTKNMYDYSVNNDNFFPMMGYLLAASAVNYGMLGLVWVCKIRRAKAAKKLEVMDFQKSSIEHWVAEDELSNAPKA